MLYFHAFSHSMLHLCFYISYIPFILVLYPRNLKNIILYNYKRTFPESVHLIILGLNKSVDCLVLSIFVNIKDLRYDRLHFKMLEIQR